MINANIKSWHIFLQINYTKKILISTT